MSIKWTRHKGGGFYVGRVLEGGNLCGRYTIDDTRRGIWIAHYHHGLGHVEVIRFGGTLHLCKRWCLLHSRKGAR